MRNPILYSFRRCPYAIRARMALYYSGVVCELREVVLKSKPAQMLSVSPKGTVPVLLIPNDDPSELTLIEESIDVVDWSLSQGDPDNWRRHSCQDDLIQQCDNEFKHWLDRYKYADRYPEADVAFYFHKACGFLETLEQHMLESSDKNTYFVRSNEISVLDIAIFPFVRQFAFVDKSQFDSLKLSKVQTWLAYFLNSDVFLSVMQKYPMWVKDETRTVLFGQS